MGPLTGVAGSLKAADVTVRTNISAYFYLERQAGRTCLEALRDPGAAQYRTQKGNLCGFTFFNFRVGVIDTVFRFESAFTDTDGTPRSHRCHH